MGARLLQPWHQMRSKSGKRRREPSQEAREWEHMPGAHGGCEAREREDDEERMLRFASKSASSQRDKPPTSTHVRAQLLTETLLLNYNLNK